MARKYVDLPLTEQHRLAKIISGGLPFTPLTITKAITAIDATLNDAFDYIDWPSTGRLLDYLKAEWFR